MRKRIAYCVSGHGLGHAGRAVAVVQALTARLPHLEIALCSNAPAFMFGAALGPRVTLHPGVPEVGMAEADTLTIDVPGTLQRLRRARGGHAGQVEAAVQLLRSLEVDAVLADVPVMAGYAAESLGLPSVAITNFTWDWIYEPLLADQPDGSELLEWVRGGYRPMEALLRLPLSGHWSGFPAVHDFGFLARTPGRSRAEIEALLGLSPADDRPRILPAVRGGTGDLLDRAAAAHPDFLFLVPNHQGPAAENLLPVRPDADLTFDELLQLADVVVAKPGWGIFNDCAVHRKALLYVARTGFREDALSVEVMPRYLRMHEISREEYEAGNWGGGLRRLLSQPEPGSTPATDGSPQLAGWLTRWLS